MAACCSMPASRRLRRAKLCNARSEERRRPLYLEQIRVARETVADAERLLPLIEKCPCVDLFEGLNSPSPRTARSIWRHWYPQRPCTRRCLNSERGLKAVGSFLKRIFGWSRVLDRGQETFASAVHLAGLAYNLTLLARINLAKQPCG